MSWKAIRCISKMTEQELWHPRRTERPVLLNRITNAAEEAVKLLPKFLQAMAMLEDLAQTLNDVPGHEGYEDLARNAGEFVFSESYHGYTCWEFEYAEKLQKKAGLFDRAVELLRDLIAGALELDLSHESMPVQRAAAFLHEMEGK